MKVIRQRYSKASREAVALRLPPVHYGGMTWL
jgi:hypothetical protein